VDQGNIVGDFNGTLGNLGGDVQGLEERSFFRTHTSILGRHFDVEGSKSTSLGRGFDSVVCAILLMVLTFTMVAEATTGAASEAIATVVVTAAVAPAPKTPLVLLSSLFLQARKKKSSSLSLFYLPPMEMLMRPLPPTTTSVALAADARGFFQKCPKANISKLQNQKSWIGIQIL
jgi:hypothetical protein